MAASSKGLTKRNGQSRDDRISDLPDELLFHILLFLPSKTAVTTSLLSKRWKNLWTSCPNWEFELQQSPAEAVESVNQFLRFHSSPKIKRFRLSFDLSSSNERCYFTEVEKWIDLAGKKGVEEIDLNLGSQHQCHDFCYHAISFTSIKPLTSLKTLSLTKITISHDLIQTLILECHLLEILDFTMCMFLEAKLGISAHDDIRLTDLILEDCIDLDEIEISCPNLVSFHYYGRPVKFQFNNNPCLTYAVFGFDEDYKDYIFADDCIRFASSLQFLLDHSNLRSLTLHPSLIKIIQKNDYRCPCFCGSSKPMVLQVEGGDEIIFISSVMRFLKKFTQLEKISIDLGIVHVDMMKPYDYEPVVVLHLKTIELELGGGRHERSLLKFLLEKAVVLETISLSISSSAPWYRRREVELQYRQLQWKILRFPRASSCAKIVFM